MLELSEEACSLHLQTRRCRSLFADAAKRSRRLTARPVAPPILCPPDVRSSERKKAPDVDGPRRPRRVERTLIKARAGEGREKVSLGQTVIVENVAGANGGLGVGRVARLACQDGRDGPDGRLDNPTISFCGTKLVRCQRHTAKFGSSPRWRSRTRSRCRRCSLRRCRSCRCARWRLYRISARRRIGDCVSGLRRRCRGSSGRQTCSRGPRRDCRGVRGLGACMPGKDCQDARDYKHTSSNHGRLHFSAASVRRDRSARLVNVHAGRIVPPCQIRRLVGRTSLRTAPASISSLRIRTAMTVLIRPCWA
jgi:hypothetical protein